MQYKIFYIIKFMKEDDIMDFTILGSGGALRIPRACCSCRICKEARLKGFPYKRLGQSLFLHDEFILFDTPEDINEELNIHSIKDVKHIFYSHWHPDHILGCRIIETLRSKQSNKEPINIYMPDSKIDVILNKDNSLFSFYKNNNYCRLIEPNNIYKINSIIITKIKLLNNFSYAYLIESNKKRVLYCPCHSMHLPISSILYNLDLLIMGLGYVNSISKNVTNFERDCLRIIRELKPKKTIFTHIEEIDNLSYDDYLELEKEYRNCLFSYDGMKISI